MKKINKEDNDFLKNISNINDLDDFISRIYKQGVENLLKAELTEHLGYEKNKKSNTNNYRNGISGKKLKTNIGDILIDIPRDRDSSFDPIIVPKHHRISTKISDAVITLYSKGMSTRDIEETIKEIYGLSVSASTVSHITDSVLDDIKDWQSRPLDELYCIVWADGLSVKMRHNGIVINKTIYLVIGLTVSGRKDVLGMWISETESASFWLHVFTDIRGRGVKDILIACTDNLKGIQAAIRTVFKQTVGQLCIVHQIRNSCKYVVWKDKKEFVQDLKFIYSANNEEQAADALKALDAKWGKKYNYAIKSWQDNWEDLMVFLGYPPEIRRIIYTTNIIESLNSGVRKYIKIKTVFPDEFAAKKSVFLAIQNIQKKWTMPIIDWGMILNQFKILYNDRIKL